MFSNKTLFILFIVAIFVLSGCGKDLPPEPNHPGASEPENIGGMAFHVGDTIDEAYAPPWDLFEDESTEFVEIFTIDPENITITDEIITDLFLDLYVDVTHMDGLIYKKGFLFVNDSWEEFEFDEDPEPGSNWIKDFASYLWVTDNLCNGPRYLVAYSCKKQNGAWQCGCKDTQGDCGYWMIQEFPVSATVCSSGQDYHCIEDELYECANSCWSYKETCDTYRTCSESAGSCVRPEDPEFEQS